MSHDAHEQLDWLAFQYIAGELSATDEASFEQRLAEDQAAREAVARAVLLGDAIATAAPSATVATQDVATQDVATQDVATQDVAGSRKSTTWWSMAAVAACLAILIAYAATQRDDVASRTALSTDTQTTDTQPTASGELASAWSQHLDYWHGRLDSTANAVDQDEDLAKEIEAQDGPNDDVQQTAPTNVAVPDWMMLAVSDLAGDMDMTSDVPDER